MPSKCTRVSITIAGVLGFAFGIVAIVSTNKPSAANSTSADKAYVSFNIIGLLLLVPVVIMCWTSFCYCRAKIYCPVVMIVLAILSCISFLIALAVFLTVARGASRTGMGVEGWLMGALLASFSTVLSCFELLISH